MGNFTKIERYLNDIEKHLKVIADSMDGNQDIEICNTASNLYLNLDEVVFIESEKVFAGMKFTVYLENTEDDELIERLENCEKIIKNQYPDKSITVIYAPVEHE